MKKRIQRELELVNREVNILKKEPRTEELEGFGDNTPLSEDVDAGAATEDRELRSDRLGRLLDRAAALDEALHRLDDGSYGLCISCGGPISKERLEAVPEAARCTRCQAELERASPAELKSRVGEGYEKAQCEEDEETPKEEVPRP